MDFDIGPKKYAKLKPPKKKFVKTKLYQSWPVLMNQVRPSQDLAVLDQAEVPNNIMLGTDQIVLVLDEAELEIITVLLQ